MTFLLQNWPCVAILVAKWVKMMCNKENYSWNISVNLSSNYLPKPGQKVPFLMFPL